MDEADDSDIKLQRDSANITEELRVSIPLFLYRGVNVERPDRVRRWVRRHNTAKLDALVNAFQEWPQLLDTTLRLHAEPLVSAFKDYILQNSSHYLKKPTLADDSIEPLPRAVCKLLYSLCKVRGPKIISIFFSNEPSLLEPMLDAFEQWDSDLTWKEKYVMLLWLSHLAQTPFDLAIVSSSNPSTSVPTPSRSPSFTGFPTVASRLLTLGFNHLVSASKEQEAARQLVVRLCLRPDMDRLGLKARCVEWALQRLESRATSEQLSLYSITGSLSFIAGFFKSSTNSFVAPFLSTVIDQLQELVASDASHAKIAFGSASVRKLVVKIYRASAVHLLSGCPLPSETDTNELEILGNIIDHLITSLGDRENPVRFAASKALSIIAQKLDPDMAEQLLDGLTESLREDVTLAGAGSGQNGGGAIGSEVTVPQQDLSGADPLRWQGLILTLSHLLYRHSAPKWKLSELIRLLVTGLDFEQRSSTGASMGSSVRDAACFGIWSVARKYSTAELSQVDVSKIDAKTRCATIFQLLGAQLVLTATLDPEGNVRRAASAALQELVGRHPDEVPNGIDLVQIVDYQAVGLRSRAITTVLQEAASLGSLYLHFICDGLLSWRAINSPDPAIRRISAHVIGQMYRLYGFSPLTSLQRRIESSQARSLDEWHGLYLALAATIRQGSTILISKIVYVSPGDSIKLLQKDSPLTETDVITSGKKAYLPAEALCTMISALAVAACGHDGPGSTDRDRVDLSTLEYHLVIIEASFEHGAKLLTEVYSAASIATFNLLDEEGQAIMLVNWGTKVINSSARHIPEEVAARVSAIGLILQNGSSTQAVPKHVLDLIYDVLMLQLGNGSHWLARVAALKSLYLPVYLCRLRDGCDIRHLDRVLLDCLDDRSIVNSREVGSEVRTQAIATVDILYLDARWEQAQRIAIFERVFGLGVEKLDKVRDSAWGCTRKHADAVLPESNPYIGILLTESRRMASLSTSSVTYFQLMLALCNNDQVRTTMIGGFTTTASSGNEALLGAARLAIANFVIENSPHDVDKLYQSLLDIISHAMPAGRLLWPALEAVAFLLAMNSTPGLMHTFHPISTKAQPQSPSRTVGWHGLLDHMAALHKGSNIRNWETMVQIYTELARHDDLRHRVMSILLQLLGHRRLPRVRLAAAAALFVIQPNSHLKIIDFADPISAASRKQVQAAYTDGAMSR